MFYSTTCVPPDDGCWVLGGDLPQGWAARREPLRVLVPVPLVGDGQHAPRPRPAVLTGPPSLCLLSPSEPSSLPSTPQPHPVPSPSQQALRRVCRVTLTSSLCSSVCVEEDGAFSAPDPPLLAVGPSGSLLRTATRCPVVFPARSVPACALGRAPGWPHRRACTCPPWSCVRRLLRASAKGVAGRRGACGSSGQGLPWHLPRGRSPCLRPHQHRVHPTT